MVLKYLIKSYPFPTLYFGIANVIANGLVMLRYVSFSLVAVLVNGQWGTNAVGVVRWCSGFRRTLKTIIPIIWLYE